SLYHPRTFPSTKRIATMTKECVKQSSGYHISKRIQQDSAPSVHDRFVEGFDLYLQAVNDQATHRTSGVIPTLEEYIRLRRDDCGCKICFSLIEYANDLDIPDDVMDHPVVGGFHEAANDFVAWSNGKISQPVFKEIFSYAVEKNKGVTYNMVAVVMHHNALDLPAVLEFVGEMCEQALARFASLKKELPSWGPKIDRDVARYIQGLADWISGTLYWSFETQRYFGKAVKTVKATRTVRVNAT
ncbi:isoprenoid synthase domain-containing protein, partial [Mycena vulgaris]